MHRTLIPLLLLIATVLPPPAAATTTVTAEYEYISGATFSLPLLSFNQALCDEPDEVCLGGAVFDMHGLNLEAAASDDAWGGQVAMTICVWHPDGPEACSEGDATSGPGCGPQRILHVPYLAERGVVHVHTLFVGSDLGLCGASQGILRLTMY